MDGKFDLSGRGVIVGVDFADNLQLQVGDTLSIYSVREIKKMKEARDHKREVTILPDDYEVRGIFDTGYYEYNARVIVTSLANAQDLYDLEDSVHGLFVMLDDPYQADTVKTQLEQTLNYKLDDGTYFTSQSWMDDNSGILSALVVEKNVMFYLLFFIVLVAALCILSAQITFVIQKTREIGMLKALGATQLQISGIFLVQSAIIGVIGRGGGVRLGHAGGGLSERVPAFHAQRHGLGIVSQIGLWFRRTAGARSCPTTWRSSASVRSSFVCWAACCRRCGRDA